MVVARRRRPAPSLVVAGQHWPRPVQSPVFLFVFVNGAATATSSIGVSIGGSFPNFDTDARVIPGLLSFSDF
ncbi:hypothetical protein BDA96_10G255700 [Sorghum bicolor]|uniref:Uncharacterized protein n=1 Tax=Sorghum bicolor TaxID=4558 RepID=A0A921Q4G5_SORBI|nr:hypothetical protein BDA96_10G255700 [Sorghum bicolor]